MSTVKILRRACACIITGDSYGGTTVYAMPFTEGAVMQEFDQIDDEAISGSGYRDIPMQGVRHVKSDGMALQVEPTFSAVLLEAAFGSNVGKVFSLGANSKKLFIVTLDSANANLYTSLYVNKLAFSSKAGEKCSWSADIIGQQPQVRQATSNYPTATAVAYGLPFIHSEFGGTGYFRVGDADGPLGSGDEVQLSSFDWSIDNAFGEAYANENRLGDVRGILDPLFGQTGWPTAEGSFTVPRHTSDSWLAWAEDHTPLQMRAYLYKSASASLLIEIPRFVISATLSDDDETKVNVTMHIGRNGMGTSYTNSNMAFTSPIRVTLVNT